LKNVRITDFQNKGREISPLWPPLTSYVVGFQAFTEVMFQVEVFWVVTPGSVVVKIPTFQTSMLPPSSPSRTRLET